MCISLRQLYQDLSSLCCVLHLCFCCFILLLHLSLRQHRDSAEWASSGRRSGYRTQRRCQISYTGFQTGPLHSGCQHRSNIHSQNTHTHNQMHTHVHMLLNTRRLTDMLTSYTNTHTQWGLGIENRFLFRTSSLGIDSLDSLAKFLNNSDKDSRCGGA